MEYRLYYTSCRLCSEDKFSSRQPELNGQYHPGGDCLSMKMAWGELPFPDCFKRALFKNFFRLCFDNRSPGNIAVRFHQEFYNHLPPDTQSTGCNRELRLDFPRRDRWLIHLFQEKFISTGRHEPAFRRRRNQAISGNSFVSRICSGLLLGCIPLFPGRRPIKVGRSWWVSIRLAVYLYR